MIVDASAVLAILLDEPEAERFAEAIAYADAPRIAAPNWLEVAMKLEIMARDEPGAAERAGTTLKAYTDALLRVVPFTEAHAELARDAFRRFGRGRHRARLNFGDRIAYAVARSEQVPLLFKGDDFVFTDIEPALRA